MTYHLSIQEIDGATMGHTQTEIVPLVGDWVTIPDAPGEFEVVKRKFRYDTKAKQIQPPKEEWPMVMLFVKKVPEKRGWSEFA